MSGNFLSCSKGVNVPFDVQGGSCDLPLRRLGGIGPHLTWKVESPGFPELQQVPLDLRWGSMRPSLMASRKASLHASWEGPLGIPLQLVPGPKTSCGFEAGT